MNVYTSKENKYTAGIKGTWASEIRKAIKGVQEGYTYTMKIDYTHFPTRVSVRGNIVVIENFLGERSARNAEIIGQTKVNVKGDKVTIHGIDKKDTWRNCCKHRT
ncbi:50S ribosomal protein L6P, partial [mine drainage metagenome]